MHAREARLAGASAEQAVEQARAQAAQRGSPITHDKDVHQLHRLAAMITPLAEPRARPDDVRDARHLADEAMRAGAAEEQAVETALTQMAERGDPITNSKDLDELRGHVATTAASGGPRVPPAYLDRACSRVKLARLAGASPEEAVQQARWTAEARFGYPMTNAADVEALRQAAT